MQEEVGELSHAHLKSEQGIRGSVDLHRLEKIDAVEQNTRKREKPHMSLDEASEYTGYAKATLYSMTCRKQIPYYKRGRILYFSVTELDNWILDKNNRQKTNDEIENEAITKVVSQGVKY